MQNNDVMRTPMKLLMPISAAWVILLFLWPSPGNASFDLKFFSQPYYLIAVIISVVILLAAAGLSIFFWLRSRKPQRVLLRAQKALEAEQLGKAKKILGKIIKRLSKKAEPGEAEMAWLQEAHLLLASLFEMEEQPEVATHHYQASFEAGLRPPQFPTLGLKRLAPVLAQSKDTREAALAIYLAYLDLTPNSSEAAGVYLMLETLGTFPEINLAEPKVTAAEINRVTTVARKVADRSPEKTWAHLSLGLAAMLAGNFEEALPHFVKACQLAPHQSAAFYWLGQACRFKKEPYFKGVRNAFVKFLQLSQGEAEQDKRAEAASYLGSSLMAAFDLDWTAIPPVSPQQDERLAEAITWLQRALSEGRMDGQTYFHLGKAHILRGQYPEATTAMERAVAAQPQQWEYRFALGMTYLSSQRRAEAEKQLLLSLNLAPEEGEIRWVLVQMYIEDQRWAEAANQANDLLKLTGPVYEVLGILILALYNQGKYAEVAAQAEAFQTFCQQPQASPIVYIIARSQALMGAFALAVDWYRRVRALEPSLDVDYYMACALAQAERYDEALEVLQPVLESANDYQVSAYVQQGHILLKMGQDAAAQESYLKALSFEPENPEIFYALGVTAFHLGDLDRANDLFGRCLRGNSDHSGALLGTGLVREALGDPEGAIPYFTRLLDIDQGHPVAHERLAIILCQKGDYRASLDHFLRLEGLAAEREEALYHLGFTLLHEGDTALAVKMWTELAARHPEDRDLMVLVARAQYLYGRRMVEEGHYAEAAVLWNDYHQVFSDDQETQKGLAEIHWRLALTGLKEEESDFPRAIALVQRAHELHADHWKYPYFLALLQLAKGDVSAAKAILEGLVEKFPSQQRIRYHLGLVLMLLGERERGLGAWQAVTTPGSSDGFGDFAVFALANEYIGQGDYQKAVELLAPVWQQQSEQRESRL